MPTVDTVSFILVKEGRVLVERRRLDKRTDPGVVAIPGGHVDPGETKVEACRRELMEELGVSCCDFTLFARMLCHAGVEDQMNHWYLCDGWTGEPRCYEAEEVFYITRDTVDTLDMPIDRKVITRLYQEVIPR